MKVFDARALALGIGLTVNALAIGAGAYWIGATQRYRPAAEDVIVDGYTGNSVRCVSGSRLTSDYAGCGEWLELPVWRTPGKEP